MTVPANLVDKTRRWEFTSSVRERGFQADRASVEYASIDLATYDAVADGINSAVDTDPLSIVVIVDNDVPVELFRGVIMDWRLEERFSRGGRETVGVLEAQDERTNLLRTNAPATVQFLGTVINQLGLPVTGQTSSQAIRQLASLVGMDVQIDAVAYPGAEYNLYQPPVTADMSIGAAVAALLDPVQGDRRGLRVDFVRRGGIYQLQQRAIPVGAADFTLDAAATKVRSYRRSFPKDPEDPFSAATPGAEFDPQGGGGTYAGLPRERLYSIRECYPLPFGTGLGEVCRTYTFGRLTEENVDKTLIATDGTTLLIEDDAVYSYDTHGRMVRRVNETRENRVLMRRDDVRFIFNDDGKIQVEYTERFERDRTGVLVRTQVVTNSKAESEAGVMKTLMTERITNNRIITEDRVYEFSPGDMQATPEYNAPLASRLREVPVVSTAQQGRSLIEVELDAPLDTRIVAGSVITVGAPSLASQTAFYVTSVHGSWHRQSGHGMRISGEAWVT